MQGRTVPQQAIPSSAVPKETENMKKILMLLLIAASLIAVSGCRDDAPDDDPSLPVRDPPQIPTVASPTDTMEIDELLDIVNLIMDFEEGHELDRNYAAAYPDGDEIIYHFDDFGIEVVLFADRETDYFLYGHFTTRWNNEIIAAEMARLAYAFLLALEPNEHERMLLEVIILDDVEGISGEDEHFWPYGVQPKTSSGDEWTITNHGTLVNIYPNSW
jgi:hypothetical protein